MELVRVFIQTSTRQLNSMNPGGGSVRITTPTTKAAFWGGGHELTLSLLKTDVIDRRYVDREHFTLNETPDYMEEAKKILLEAEKLGFEGIAAENEAWYDALYEKREQGRILLGATQEESNRAADSFFDEAMLL